MALDENDKTEIAKLIGAAMKEHVSPLGAEIAKLKQVDTSKLIADEIAKLKAEAGDDKGKGGDDKGKGGKVDPATAAKLEALERQLETEKAEREKAEGARKEERMLSALRTQLGKAGVPAHRINHAVALLHNAEGRISLDDAGRATLKFDRTSSAGPYADNLPLDKGLAEWLGTDDGKAFLPAKKVAGADIHGKGKKPLAGQRPVGVSPMQALKNGLLGKALEVAEG